MIERSMIKLVWYQFEFVRDFLYTSHAPLVELQRRLEIGRWSKDIDDFTHNVTVKLVYFTFQIVYNP